MSTNRSRLAGTSTQIDSDFRDDPLSDTEISPPDESIADVELDEDRRRRIAQRAYGRAERRGFAPGRELDDWLAAEAEEDESDPEQASR